MHNSSWIAVTLILFVFAIAIWGPQSTLGLIDWFRDGTQVSQRTSADFVGGAGVDITHSDSAGNNRITYTITEGVLAKSGIATVGANATTTDVTHGLGQAPDRILLTPRTNWDSVIWYVSASSTTTFTIRHQTATTTPVTYDWRAQEEEE